MLGGSIKAALPAAAAVELVHNFTLVHDDIMDNDELRHGVDTVHKNFGIPLAILAGDILFSKAFQFLAINGRQTGLADSAITEMVSKLAAACMYVCEGQATDVNMASNSRFSTEYEYLDMIRKKTAALFEVSCSMGALSSPYSTSSDIENLASFGKNAGIAFQLIDDLIGIIGDPKVTGKAVGNDIREGKKTYPILLALKKAKPQDKDRILSVFGSKNASSTDIKQVVKIISSLGIDEDARTAAKQHVEKAIKSIEKYKDSDAKQALESSARFIVERSL
jgi:geranylgeranyl diphosphate synthase type I